MCPGECLCVVKNMTMDVVYNVIWAVFINIDMDILSSDGNL